MPAPSFDWLPSRRQSDCISGLARLIVEFDQGWSSQTTASVMTETRKAASAAAKGEASARKAPAKTQHGTAFELPAVYVNSTHVALSTNGLVRFTFGERERGVIYRRAAVLMNVEGAKGFAENLLAAIAKREKALSEADGDESEA